MNIEKIANEILKEAGFGGIAKKVGQIGTGAMLGAGIGGSMAASKNEENGITDPNSKVTNIAGKSLGGALIGGAAAGLGGSAINGIKGMFKKSEMEVPTDTEKTDELSDSEKEVKESPNPDEIDRMRHSLDKKEQYKKLIEEKARESSKQ